MVFSITQSSFCSTFTLGGAGGAGSQNIPENNPPPVFAKKSPIYDNPEPEIIQPTQPYLLIPLKVYL